MCGSSYILPETQYHLLLQTLTKLNEDTSLLDHLIALKSVLIKFRITGRPLEVLVFLEGLLKQAQSFKKAEKFTTKEEQQ